MEEKMKSLSPRIVRAMPDDLPILKKISIQTFTESFAYANSEDDMELYLRETFNDAILSKELNDSEVHYYIIYEGKNPAGYLKLNSGNAQKEFFSEPSLEIERVYILKEFQNRNIGQHLLDNAFHTARQAQIKLIWLGVWEKNPGAIKFYKRNDFVEFGKHPFVLGRDKQTDILMKRHL